MLSSTSWKHGHQSSSRVLAPIVRVSLRRPRPDSESFSIAPISLTHQPCLLPKATNSTVAPAFKPSSSKGEPLWSSIAMTQHLARRDPSRFSQNIGIQQQLQQHRQSEQGMDVDPLRVTRAVGGDQDGLRTSSSKRWAIGFSVLRILVTLNRRPEWYGGLISGTGRRTYRLMFWYPSTRSRRDLSRYKHGKRLS